LSCNVEPKRPHSEIEHRTDPCYKKIKSASPRKQHSAITATDRIPMAIDPFRRRELKDPAYIKQKIALWKAHWSCQLSCWKSTYSLRTLGCIGDRYWFPPNTKDSDVTVRIRCAPDLTSFLDYCVSQQPVCNGDSVAPNPVDYGLLLRQWGGGGNAQVNTQGVKIMVETKWPMYNKASLVSFLNRLACFFYYNVPWPIQESLRATNLWVVE